MMRPEDVTRSKLLSLVLRHDPGVVGVQLSEGGWVDLDVLAAALRRVHADMTPARLRDIAAQSDKQRFELSPDATRIRAAQGHSIGVRLGLPPVEPPAELFHGTAQRNVSSIRAGGLLRGVRDHVHLSQDAATARAVGRRHGRPVVLVVDAAGMTAEGHEFLVAHNGVWLTRHVPVGYIRFPEEG